MSSTKSYSVDAVATVTKSSKAEILRAIHDKQLKAKNHGTREEPQWRVTPKAVANWILEHNPTNPLDEIRK